MSRDLLFLGLAVSLSWHILWASLIVPVIKMPVYFPKRSESVFLGSVLTESDLLACLNPVGRKSKEIFLKHEDFSRGSYVKKWQSSMYKPMLSSQNLIFSKQPPGSTTAPPAALPVDKNISFGFSDYSNYIFRADFSELKKMASREDLSSHIDFKVLITQMGQVKSIKKVTGSGDPALDFYVMFKLKEAIFKQGLAHQEDWFNVRFKIKE